MNNPTKSLSRYARQAQFAPLGDEGQRRLAAGRVFLCGCGALGSILAEMLARAGVGFLRIVDRDFLEPSNLQRQFLYDEADVAAGLPKSIAAADRLRKINSQIEIEPIVADVDSTNILALARDVDVLLDGTDNFETRYLINDAAIELGTPWIYGGCIGAEGRTMTIIPGETACLACLMPEPPPAGSTPTCDTAGILGPAVGMVASLQAAEAIKLLSGQREAINRSLTVVDVWENRLRQLDLRTLRDRTDCRACKRRQLDWLEGKRGSRSSVLCGRRAVHLSSPAEQSASLEALAEKLSSLGGVTVNPYLLRFVIDDYQITVFADGRAIVSGTSDPATARTVYARYVGS